MKTQNIHATLDRHGRAGFTLVELLVVTSIISLLVAIMLPSLGKARQQTRQVICMDQLRNIGLALQMYIYNNDDRLPFIDEALYQAPGTPGPKKNWDADPSDRALYPFTVMNVLTRELGNPEVLVCPSAVLGYPSTNYKMTYRVASADNATGKTGDIYKSDGNLGYYYNLKTLDGRKYRVEHLDTSNIRATVYPKVKGPGPYYLFRDFIGRMGDGQDLGSAPVRFPHPRAYNQLFLDFRVERTTDETSFLGIPNDKDPNQ